jgi:hypothetical protein
MNKLKFYSSFMVVVAGILMLSGCASNPSVGGMTYSYTSTIPPRDKNLIHNVTVSSVAGGEETNPLWKSRIDNANFETALIDSLKSAKLYQQLAKSNYLLQATLIRQDQPTFGLDLKVTTTVNYTLTNKRTKKTVFHRTITSAYTATFNDSVLAVTRLKDANEGAIRQNIKMLISALYQLRQ